mmetsp:Transcript_12452/g.46064  ORF Transcript_12452/g.46064 Transcript_12452/m.46064 type:complete len:212 (+) Transcript_12452:299-934(+)
MLLCGPKVLPEGHDVDAHASEIAHGLDHLFSGLPKPDHDAGLCVEVWIAFLRSPQNRQALRIVRALVSDGALESLYRLDVVRVHIKAARCKPIHRLKVALKVAHKALDQHPVLDELDELHRAGKVIGTAIRHVIPVHRGQHHILDAPPGDGLRRVERLPLVGSRRGWRRLYGAESASSRARVAQQHDRASAAVPALADIRTLGLFAHRREA